MLQYERVVQTVSSMIYQGLLKEGDRIPSLRSMSDQTGTSINTVRQAYDRLEQHFLIESVPQSGYYVRSLGRELQALPARDPLKMNPLDVGMCRIFSMYQERGELDAKSTLGIAALSPELYPTKELMRITGEIAREGNGQVFGYQIPPGYLPLREQLALRAKECGVDISPNDIVITNGCHEALYLILSALCQKGDTVVLETPFYFHFLNMLEKLELNVIEIPATEEGISLETLDFILDRYPVAAMITASNFSNPLGFSHPREKKKALLEILEKRKIPLIEDDVYGELHFNGKHRETYSALAEGEQEVYLCSSFSKSLGPGLRIGWVWPGKYREAVIDHKTIMNLGASSMEQIMLTRYLKGGLFSKHLRKIRRVIKENSQVLERLFREALPGGSRVTQPEGGMFLWVTLPNQFDTMELYRKAQAKGILIAPGVLFSQSRDYSHSFRINTGYLPEDPEAVVQAIVDCLQG
ncbi:MAG: PLP-dependent aminotransferase family protein [Spirochaetales bacterium]|nr:PLP-dependent aminotransferase family protein [Spirochaetales bacterium]